MLLKVCERRESTGRAIFDLLDRELKQRGISWSNCISFAADNAAVMQGMGKGVAAFLKAQHPHIHLIGCACHLMHLAAEKASRVLGINVEDFLITIYYYLDKSSKRKSNLRDVQMMCNTEVRKILKMVSTRWLSLGQCVNRLLQQWEALTVFFENDLKAGKKQKTSMPQPPKKTHPAKLYQQQCSQSHPPASLSCQHPLFILHRYLTSHPLPPISLMCSQRSPLPAFPRCPDPVLVLCRCLKPYRPPLQLQCSQGSPLLPPVRLQHTPLVLPRLSPKWRLKLLNSLT